MNFELKVKAPQNAPVVWNYDELKKNLETALADFSNRVYTEDMITEAKEDKAKLNKLKKAISHERIPRKKEYMQPFETFENQAKELCDLIETALSGISHQLEIFEDKRISDKQKVITSIYDVIISNYDISFLTLEKIFNEKWLNKSVSEKAIAEEITAICERIIKDIEVIRKMPKYAFEAEEAYKTSLDLNKALDEGEKMAEIQAKKHQVSSDDSEERFEVSFKCRITKSQAEALVAFCKENKITIEKI